MDMGCKGGKGGKVGKVGKGYADCVVIGPDGRPDVLDGRPDDALPDRAALWVEFRNTYCGGPCAVPLYH